MFGRLGAPLLVAAILASCGAAAPQSPGEASLQDGSEWVTQCTDWDEWDKPGPPFRIYGDSYYVGTCGISAVLIAGDEGHVLIDGGTEAGAAVIARNIASLGFKLSDVNLILMSHEHFDHAGGIAWLQQQSGARLMTSPAAKPVMESGSDSPDDPQHGMHEPMRPARVDGTLLDGDEVALGNIALTAIATPGHTPGAMSWSWRECEVSECKTIVYVDSMSPVSSDDYRFSDHPEYLAAYRSSIAKIAAQPCDILLAPHPSAAGMRDKLVAGELATDDACADYASGVSQRLDERLAKEADG